MSCIFRAFAMCMWIGGWVVAQGGWQTFFAIVIPPYGWYLTIDALAHYFGILT